MTNKEAIRRILDHKRVHSLNEPRAVLINEALDLAIKALEERPQGEIKKYKPLEPDYNVQCAVENLRAAYWSNEPEKVAKNFTEAEDIIISAICHHGYAVCKQPQGEWILVSERLPNTLGVYNVTRKIIEGETSYFISSASYFDGQNTWYADTGINHGRPYLTDIIAWMPRPEPYTEKKNTNFYTKRFNEVN